jgi:hypothetical protein
MRLLDVDSRRVEEFIGDRVPKYAILSHTWDHEEVTFQNIHKRRATTMAGYQKIKYACEQARRDGLQKVWVDTCCIDKSSSAELSEAINSMFRWYQDAAVCYAYLADVPSQPDLLQFSCSRWFSRGWTLQELLAPPSLVFYSRNWNRLGTRRRLRDEISQMTGIHCDALSGRIRDIRKFSVAQKMSWAANRQTTRKEDIAYCLMGLFGVNMPLLYGEGEQSFIRLQEKIMEDSDDQSIFAWKGDYSVVLTFTEKRTSADGVSVSTGISTITPEGYNGNTTDVSSLAKPTLMSLLASSPSKFRHCVNIVPYRNWKQTETYSMTNAGLKITAPLTEDDGLHNKDTYRLFLRCYDEEMPDHWVGIFVKSLSPQGDQFARANEAIFRASEPLFKSREMRTIYVRKQIILPESHMVLERGRTNSVFLALKASPGCEIKVIDVRPLEMRNSKTNEGQEITILRPPHFDEVISVNYWSWHAAVRLEATHQSHSKSWDLVIMYDGRSDSYSFNLGGTNCEDLDMLWCRETKDGVERINLQSWSEPQEFLWAIEATLLDPLYEYDSALEGVMADTYDKYKTATENISLSEDSVQIHISLDYPPRSSRKGLSESRNKDDKTEKHIIASQPDQSQMEVVQMQQ